jgi:hypothetical protein
VDVSAELPAQAVRLSRLLDDWIESQPVGELGAGGDASERRQQALRQLGY